MIVIRVVVTGESLEGVVVLPGGRRVSRVVAMPAGADLALCLEQVLESAPRLIRPLVRPTIHVGPPHVQSRTVKGLPLTADKKLLSRVLAETPDRYFLRMSGGRFVGSVDYAEPGVVRASAFAGSFVSAVAEACRKLRFSSASIVPTSADYGNTALLVAATRTRRSLAVRAAIAVAAVLILALGWTFIPVGVARTRAEADADYVAAAAQKTEEIARHSSNLNDISTTLNRVGSFEGSRTSAAGLLQDVAEALPDSVLVTALRFSGELITITVLSSDAGIVVRRLADMTGVTKVSIEGPITREVTNDRERERVTVRFAYSPPARWRQPLNPIDPSSP